MSTKEITISKEVAPVITQAQKFNIVDKESMATAVDYLSKLNKENDKIIEEKEKITKPLNEALKVERARWAPVEKMLKTAIDIYRTKMSAYQTNLIQEQRKQEQKIADRLAKGTIKQETAMRKMDELEVVDNKTTTDNGSILFRTDYVLEITSLKDIPLEYMEPKESVITRDLKAGKIIAGCKLKEVLTPVNRR
jgi:hypothetical protein